ncbi:MAG: DegV family protein [Anaerolineae bacterium]|nr:DegV family protein [Anaerolineae bacterium]
MAIRIVTDSTSDLPPALADEYGITVIPSYVNIGDESYRDLVDLSRAEFYEQLPRYPRLPTTAAPAVGVFAETYRQLIAEGATAIISIHVSAELSAMCNAARLGAEEIPEIPVHIFDSRQLSMGLGFLALLAARATDRTEADGILQMLAGTIARTHVFAALDTLEYLRRSGRVSWAEFSIGTLLRIKPTLHVYEGEVHSLAKVRTRGRALSHLVQEIAALGPLQEVALLHTHDPEGLAEWRALARPLFPDNYEPVAVEVTPAIGAHVGPGALGLACITA